MDSRNRRASALGVLLPFRPAWPDPEGSLASQADRQHVAYSYAGAAAAEPEPPDPGPSASPRVLSTSPATLFARPAWSRSYLFDFSAAAELRAGEALLTCGVASSPPGLTVGTPAVSGTVARVTIGGGSAGTTYSVTCTVTTSGGATLAQRGYLAVE